MIINPAILALISGSAFISFLLLYSSAYGIRIIRKWDLTSGSELQLSLEKKTYLISTMMAYALGFQLISLFLFIYTADSLSSLFTGAMCAAGTLNANRFGYAVFILKIMTFILSGLWLLLNHADNRAYDYPLIRRKYYFLTLIMPVVLAETILQGFYFAGLEADLITSCCGSLFSSSEEADVHSIFDLPANISRTVFYISNLSVIATGAYFLRGGKGAYLFSAAGIALFIISSWSLMHFISIHIYEMPSHHCPFCMLKREYGHVGYIYYLTALAGCIASAGTGMLQPFRKIGSLSDAIPQIQRRLVIASLLCSVVYFTASAYAMIFTDFRMV